MLKLRSGNVLEQLRIIGLQVLEHLFSGFEPIAFKQRPRMRYGVEAHADSRGGTGVVEALEQVV